MGVGGGGGGVSPPPPRFRREFQHHRSNRGRELVQVVPAAQSKPVEQHRDDSDRLLEVNPGPWLAIEPAGHPVVGPDQDVDAGLVDVGVRREVLPDDDLREPERRRGALEVRTDGVAAREPDSALLAHPVLHVLEEVFGLLPQLGVVPVERPGFMRGVMRHRPPIHV